jgi:hypothetical protein
MLFRSSTGSLIEINKLDYRRDITFHEKVAQVKKSLYHFSSKDKSENQPCLNFYSSQAIARLLEE